MFGIQPSYIVNSNSAVTPIANQTIVPNASREVDNFQRHGKYFKKGKKQGFEHDNQSDNSTSFRRTFKTNILKSNIYKQSSVKTESTRTNERSYTNCRIVPSQTSINAMKPSDVRQDWTEEYANNTLAIVMLSAIAYTNTTTVGFRQDIKLIGWHGVDIDPVDIKCCISWNSSRISQYLRPRRITLGQRIIFSAAQFSCPTHGGSLIHIKGVALVSAKKDCPTNASEYIKPFIPNVQVKTHSFAICLKILYGNVDNKLLIDWIEYYREMEVDKIVMFLYNISTHTQHIVTHYTQIGIVEARTFVSPWKRSRKYSFNIFTH